MTSWQQFQYKQNKNKNLGGKVSAESYANMIFEMAFQAPFTSLEQGSKDLTNALTIVDLSAYLQEKVCVAWGKLELEDLLPTSDYSKEIETEKNKLLEAVKKNELSDSNFNAKMGYFKLSLILRRIQDTKGRSEELEV